MKAIIAQSIHADNPLAGLQVTHTADLDAANTFGEHGARIKIAANSVNHHDIWSLMGVGLSERQLPMTLGTDGAGVLVDAGSGVPGCAVGDEVVIYSVFGADNAGVGAGARRTLPSEYYPGLMQEYVDVPCAHVFAKPKNLDFGEAAALGTGWLTAYTMLFEAAGVKPGDSVLIQGAGGSVASAAIQMAHAAGLEVLVTSRSAQRQERAKQLGADYACEVGSRLPHKVDAVLDSVGQATWSHSIKSVRPGGTVVTCGATSGDQPGAELTRVFFQDIRIQGVTMGSAENFARLLRFVEHCDLHPVIDSVYSVDRARDAFARVEQGAMFGNVVLQW